MRWLILALSMAATAYLYGDTFHASAQKAEIESLRAQLATTAKYYTEFWDLMETQLEALKPQYQAEYYEARDLVRLRNTTMEKMDAAYSRAVADYEEAVNSLQSYRSQIQAMQNEVNSMLDTDGLRPPVNDSWWMNAYGFWNELNSWIPKLPNPYVAKSSGYWSSPVAWELAYGRYSGECDRSKCNCESLHGKSNIDEIYSAMQTLNGLSLKIVKLRQHPPSW